MQDSGANYRSSERRLVYWVPTSCFLAPCYTQLGQLDEAKIIIKRLRALTPVVRPNADQWRNPEQREFYLSGLRLAMSEME